MNGDRPSPPKRVVQEQAGVFEPSSVEKFDESIGPTSPRHGRHRVDHHPKFVFGILHLLASFPLGPSALHITLWKRARAVPTRTNNLRKPNRDACGVTPMR